MALEEHKAPEKTLVYDTVDMVDTKKKKACEELFITKLSPIPEPPNTMMNKTEAPQWSLHGNSGILCACDDHECEVLLLITAFVCCVNVWLMKASHLKTNRVEGSVY